MNMLASSCLRGPLSRALVASARPAVVNSYTSSHFVHTVAFARDIPDSFENALAQHSQATEPMSMELAREQHADYVKVLRRHIPVLCLPALEDCPDCVFVEDTAVVVGNRAVITNPGHPTRRGEVETIKRVLQELGVELIDMRNVSDKAICDGGDVLYTERHLFVGMSDRTNRAAAKVLEDAFDVETVLVPAVIQGDQVLHLKSAVTHIDERTLLAPTGPDGDAVLKAMQAEERGYDAVRVPDVLACNVVSINGCVLAQDTSCQESRETLEKAVKERNMVLEWVNTSELAKKDAALTCCSVLLSI